MTAIITQVLFSNNKLGIYFFATCGKIMLGDFVMCPVEAMSPNGLALGESPQHWWTLLTVDRGPQRIIAA
jgi:hypothetical protein